jgi:UTP--glucose-1-phosphate uridylyltransferase
MVTLQQTERFFAHVFEGQVHDTGTKMGFLTANLAYALDHEEFGGELRSFLRSLL